MSTQFRWQERIRSGTGRISAGGYAIVALMVGSIGYWAYTAPLAGAVVAPGAVAAAGRNILVQHLEGGVVREILAEEGNIVTAGQPLILLDTTEPLTLLNRLRNQAASLRMHMLRLETERDSREGMTFPSTLAGDGIDEAALRMFFDEQQKEFMVRQARFEAEREVFHQRVAINQEAVNALQAQKEALIRQLEVVREEISIKFKLLEKGLTYRTEYTALLRTEADLIGESGSIEAQLAASRGRVIEARADMEKHLTLRVQEAVAQLNEVRTSAIDVQQQIFAAEATLERTTLRAPADGIVVSTVYNAVGSVVSPGEKVLEILPTLPKLIIEARISPTDIRRVHRGQQARLRLTALNRRLTPEVAGTVVHVSADRLFDQIAREYYYTVRFMIDETLPPDVSMEDLLPGMPVEAMVVSESRTFLEYLAKPIADSFHRAFTED